MDEGTICPVCFLEDQVYFEEQKRNMQALWLSERSYPLVKPCERHVKPDEAATLITDNTMRIGALQSDVEGLLKRAS